MERTRPRSSVPSDLEIVSAHLELGAANSGPKFANVAEPAPIGESGGDEILPRHDDSAASLTGTVHASVSGPRPGRVLAPAGEPPLYHGTAFAI